ncbi:hypothetical protein ABGV42_01120 [Paenibacillus pabuli]|uniref:hypothetical protein n=1 Tax=Paenibacillus pabuli TaxID=1472 RepID=UPI0032421C06
MYVSVNGVNYTLEEAERLGILEPLEKNVETDSVADLELLIDTETRSFSIRIGTNDFKDVPKDVMVDVTGFGTFKGWKDYIESEGLAEDEEFLQEIAEGMKLYE